MRANCERQTPKDVQKVGQSWWTVYTALPL